MFGSILEVGSAFDWISPLVSVIGDVVNGPSYTFLIPQNCGHSGREIIRLLRQRGVNSWGHMIVQGTIMISVRQTQARWAQHILAQAGIPTEADLATGFVTSSPRTTTKPGRSGERSGLGQTLREIGDIRIF